MSDARIGGCLQTRSGVRYYPLDPRWFEVLIEDISHSLSNICRFNGHCNEFYSVAEHSVLVSQIVWPEHQLAALLHDAAEAYCCDIPTPLKRDLVGYAKIEAANWDAIAKRFKINPVLDVSVIKADRAVLLAEKAAIIDHHFDWELPGRPARVEIQCLSPRRARDAFMARFKELT